MIAVSILLHTVKQHWAQLYNSNDFDHVRNMVAAYMNLHYPGAIYTVHMMRDDGQYKIESKDPEIVLYLN